MTLDEARAIIAQEQSLELRAAAGQLLNEALALPHLPPEHRGAAIASIRRLQAIVPDYQLRSFGASVLDAVGDSLSDLAQKKVVYAEAQYLAAWYASQATSGGEGTARSRHVHEIEAKIRALDPPSGPRRDGVLAPPADSATSLPPGGRASPPLVRSPRRPAFLTGLGWVFIVVGALGIPVSVISSLMILAGSHGTQSGTFLGGLIVLLGPPATFVAGIGLLRRRRWAHGYAVAVLLLFAGHSLFQMLQGSRPEASTVSPSGLVTTQLAWEVDYPFHIVVIAICVALLVKLLSPAMRAEFLDPDTSR